MRMESHILLSMSKSVSYVGRDSLHDCVTSLTEPCSRHWQLKADIRLTKLRFTLVDRKNVRCWL